MAFVAVQPVHVGRDGVIEPGRVVPESYVDSAGESRPVDFDRLVELGAVRKQAPRKRAA